MSAAKELRTIQNKTRRLRKHLRANPFDDAWTSEMGVSSKGKRLQMRAKLRRAA